MKTFLAIALFALFAVATAQAQTVTCRTTCGAYSCTTVCF